MVASSLRQGITIFTGGVDMASRCGKSNIGAPDSRSSLYSWRLTVAGEPISTGSSDFMLGFYAASESVVNFAGTAPNRLSILLLQQVFGGQPFGTHPRSRCGIQSVY